MLTPKQLNELKKRYGRGSLMEGLVGYVKALEKRLEVLEKAPAAEPTFEPPEWPQEEKADPEDA